MKPLSERLHEASVAASPQFDESTLRHLQGSLRKKVKQRRQRRIAAAVTSAALVLVAGSTWVLTRSTSSVKIEPGPAAKSLAQVEVSADGLVKMAGAGGVQTTRVTADETQIELMVGASARFSVEPQHGRHVRILAGAVEVEVIGTVFVVDRLEREARVQVEHGTVRVTSGGIVRLLRGSEVALFSPDEQSAGETTETAESGSAEIESPDDEVLADEIDPKPESVAQQRKHPKRHKAKRSRPASAQWRTLAAAGDFDNAWDALSSAAPPRDEPEDLLRAADVARRSGHATAAIVPLQRVLSAFSEDSRAPLAAFTLGRILLDAEKRQEAAAAFARAQKLAPNGPLAADALAREVEALAKAGQVERAKNRAAEYLERFPDGTRAASVRSWAQLE